MNDLMGTKLDYAEDIVIAHLLNEIRNLKGNTDESDYSILFDSLKMYQKEIKSIKSLVQTNS